MWSIGMWRLPYRACVTASTRAGISPSNLTHVVGLLWSLRPGRCGCNRKWIIFKLNSRIDGQHFLWNCTQMNATRPRWILVNIISGNSLVPSGNKPLPDHSSLSSMTPYSVPKAQWFKWSSVISWTYSTSFITRETGIKHCSQHCDCWCQTL